LSIAEIEIGVVDVQLSEALIDKSSIGCYVYHGGRLLDVMVISELEQTLKLIFNDRAQIIQIVVKQIGQGEFKYGKHSDVISAFIFCII
jgi:hypothetical protein